MRAPVAANGWPTASDEPLTFHFGAVDGAQWRVPAEMCFAIVRVLPGAQGRQHLRGKRLMDFVEVEVLQRQAGAIEHLRDSDGWRHQ